MPNSNDNYISVWELGNERVMLLAPLYEDGPRWTQWTRWCAYKLLDPVSRRALTIRKSFLGENFLHSSASYDIVYETVVGFADPERLRPDDA